VQAEYDALERSCEDARLDAEAYRQSGSQLDSMMAVLLCGESTGYN